MAIAYVLIDCDTGFEDSIIEDLNSMTCVKETHKIFGAYDIITKVECPTIEELKETILSKIRKMEKVRSMLTEMCV